MVPAEEDMLIPAHVMLQAQPSIAPAPPGPGGFYLWGLVAELSDWIVGAVMLLLVAFSLVCWIIIIYKSVYLWLAQRESAKFLEAFWQSKRLDAIFQASEELRRSPQAQIFKAGYAELSKLKGQKSHDEAMHDRLGEMESIERALRRAQTSEVTALESMVPFLATTGSTSPFIGLFGTVLGIVGSFHQIGQQQGAGFEIVAPGLADALFATAVGLVAAIPAVIAYNHFVRRIRVVSAEMEAFASDFLNIIQRHFLK
jgi:biopolymer transport protein TolQ